MTNDAYDFSPIELNAKSFNGNVRRDALKAFKRQYRQGIYFANASYITLSGAKWVPSTCSDSNNIPLPVNEKIIVLTTYDRIILVDRGMKLCGAFNVQNRDRPNSSDVFPQEVFKCDSHPSTVARYKSTYTDLRVHSCYTDWISTTNINLSRNWFDTFIVKRSHNIYVKSINPHADSHMIHNLTKENNTSITCDNVISSIVNEKSMKENMRSHDKPFRTRYKPSFNVDRLYIRPPEFDELTFLCKCQRQNTHNYSHVSEEAEQSYETLQPSATTMAYWKKCLSPLKRGTEVQVYDRCFNCSGVEISQMKGYVARISCDLLNSSPQIRIDCASMKAKNYLQLKFNCLLPAHIHSFVDLLCWRFCTRRMNSVDQIKTYRTKIKPLLQRLVTSRQNYATAGIFVQRIIRGMRPLRLADIKLISHKYGARDVDMILNRSTNSDPKRLKIQQNRVRVRRSAGVVGRYCGDTDRYKNVFQTLQYEQPCPKYDM